MGFSARLCWTAAPSIGWIGVAGGVEAVLSRARTLAKEGRHDLACHLAETARHAAPDDPAVHALRAEVYRENSKSQSSSMGRNILNHAALASEAGRRDLAGDG